MNQRLAYKNYFHGLWNYKDEEDFFNFIFKRELASEAFSEEDFKDFLAKMEKEEGIKQNRTISLLGLME
jgi:hypothetical protein